MSLFLKEASFARHLCSGFGLASANVPFAAKFLLAAPNCLKRSKESVFFDQFCIFSRLGSALI